MSQEIDIVGDGPDEEDSILDLDAINEAIYGSDYESNTDTRVSAYNQPLVNEPLIVNDPFISYQPSIEEPLVINDPLPDNNTILDVVSIPQPAPGDLCERIVRWCTCLSRCWSSPAARASARR